MREEAKWDKYFYNILFTHLCFNCKKWLHELLEGGKAIWSLISFNYINASCGMFGGSSTFNLPLYHKAHSFLFLVGTRR